MILTEKDYAQLVKDLDSIIEKVDDPYKKDAVEQVKALELKYWRYVKEATFFQYLIKFGDLNKVLWLLDAIIETKKKLKKMQPTDKFYKNLQKDIKDWQQELFQYWKGYDPDSNTVDFANEMRKSKWIILKCGMNLYDSFIDKIFAFF